MHVFLAILQAIKRLSFKQWLAALAVVVVLAVSVFGVSARSFVPSVDVSVAIPEVDIAENETVVELPAPPRVLDIQPLGLDCRARIFMEAPIEGVKVHAAFGRVYRTDRFKFIARGDVDTCIPPSASTITPGQEAVRVNLDAAQVEFVRPRVDMSLIDDGGFEYDVGTVGQFTNAFPWVSTDTDLIPLTLHHAQEMMANPVCLERAWSATQEAITNAYEVAMAEKYELDATSVEVVFDGEPNFYQVDSRPAGDDIRFETWGEGLVCEIDQMSLTQAPIQP